MNDKPNENFNRIYGPVLKYGKKNLQLYILFNNYNTFTAYHINPKTYNFLKNKNIVKVCFDFKKSQFCNTFLDISDVKNDSCTCINTFNGIYTQFKDILHYENKETIVLDKVLLSKSLTFTLITAKSVVSSVPCTSPSTAELSLNVTVRDLVSATT